MINDVNPTEFPVSIKCFDVLNLEKKQVNVIHTFDNEKEFNHWKRLVTDWDSFPPKKNKKRKQTHYEVLKEPVAPTMEIIHFI